MTDDEPEGDDPPYGGWLVVLFLTFCIVGAVVLAAVASVVLEGAW